MTIHIYIYIILYIVIGLVVSRGDHYSLEETTSHLLFHFSPPLPLSADVSPALISLSRIQSFLQTHTHQREHTLALSHSLPYSPSFALFLSPRSLSR